MKNKPNFLSQKFVLVTLLFLVFTFACNSNHQSKKAENPNLIDISLPINNEPIQIDPEVIDQFIYQANYSMNQYPIYISSDFTSAQIKIALPFKNINYISSVYFGEDNKQLIIDIQLPEDGESYNYNATTYYNINIDTISNYNEIRVRTFYRQEDVAYLVKEKIIEKEQFFKPSNPQYDSNCEIVDYTEYQVDTNFLRYFKADSTLFFEEISISEDSLYTTFAVSFLGTSNETISSAKYSFEKEYLLIELTPEERKDKSKQETLNVVHFKIPTSEYNKSKKVKVKIKNAKRNRKTIAKNPNRILITNK